MWLSPHSLDDGGETHWPDELHLLLPPHPVPAPTATHWFPEQVLHVGHPGLQPWVSVQVDPPQPLLQLRVCVPEPQVTLHPLQPPQLVDGVQHDWMLHDWLSVVEPEHAAPQLLGLGLLHVRVRLWVPPPHETEQLDQPDQPLQPPLMGVQVNEIQLDPLHPSRLEPVHRIVPALVALHASVSLATLRPPAMSSRPVGLVVPMPTLPDLIIVRYVF